MLLLLMLSSQLGKAQSVTVGVLGNTNANPGWYKLGTLQLQQQGQDAFIKIISGAGYNADLNQNGECFVHIRTSNGSSNNNGFYAAASFYCTGRTKLVRAMKVKQLSLSQFEFYALLSTYTGTGSPIVIESYTGTWQNEFAYTATSPEGFDLPEEFFMLSSAYFYGNVGIGTSTPQAKLAVNGDIYGKRVKVTQTDWPDYVFAPGYVLPPLNDVEKYVKGNRHLPDMPTAKDVEKDGLDLGEMNKKLLQKVEELTLYLIDEHRKNGEQEATIKELRQKVQQLERSLAQ